MFGGITRRVVSIWFPRLATDRVLRVRPVEGPFALTLTQGNAERLYCLNPAAESLGLSRGMTGADARAFCPDLTSAPADPLADARFLALLRRWATRYCPWVGNEGGDGLVMDITGSAHLIGGEAALLDDLRARLDRAGLSARAGLADTRGAAWALARHGGGVAAPGAGLAAIAALPVEGLRLPPDMAVALRRLGLRRIGDLAGQPRAPLARRFGPGLMMRLDQASGQQPEAISPDPEPPRHAIRLTLPEPVGLLEDVMAATARLLDRLCERLAAQDRGARVLCLTLRRVDQESRQVELRLARALRDPARILPLFRPGVEGVDAGFGIDVMRLEALVVEDLPAQQTGNAGVARKDRLDDLITRLGMRVGLENIRRFLPAESHIPERSFQIAPAACSQPSGNWTSPRPRPLRIFAPEPAAGQGGAGQGGLPPQRFRWRSMAMVTARVTGPERIAPEWWLDDPAWRSGLRDYWQVETAQGRRLWMFHTPLSPGWFVQGEFA
ncbi:Y-family DNA polymerase [Paracoccus sp. (in: a-proteobacteria)]|uniref:Y-family DNA polymerase n=1 Tax=Paracoccus sp. TaxID=267 RepID=UPI003A8AAF2A